MNSSNKISNTEHDGSDITIVIITYNRYPFLLRLLRFYEQYDHRFNFLILDSSSDELNGNELMRYLDRDNVEYKTFNPEIFFVDKIAEGCACITTPFAVLCADDDFLIPAGILASRKFLLENTNYVSAHGLYFSHTSAEDAQKKGFTIGPLYQNGQSAEQDSGTDRLNAYLSGKTIYYPMHALHHTELFQLFWTETKTYVSDWGLSELFPSSLSFIYGKMKVLPIYYASREPNTFTWYDENRRREMYSEKKLKRASEGLGKNLSKVDGISFQEGESLVSEAFNDYLFRVERKFQQQLNQNDKKSSSFFLVLRNKIRLGMRLRLLLFQGCHSSVYPDYLEDYKRLRYMVLSAQLSHRELNRSRKDYSG